jgi:hypothetical protein
MHEISAIRLILPGLTSVPCQDRVRGKDSL